MAKSKKKVGIDFKGIINELQNSYGVSEEKAKEILENAFSRAYISILQGPKPPKDLPEPKVKVNIDYDKKTISFYQIKRIKEEVTDDMIEIDLEDAQDLFKDKELKYEDDVEILETDDVLNKQAFIEYLRINLGKLIRENESSTLYEVYKDRVGDLITGVVDRVTDKAVHVKIGRYHAVLKRSEMIGNETFNPDDQIKLYLANVNIRDKNTILITRAHEGFLKKLFEEEINEVADGTIVIKKIARIAGVRSKVAVYSRNRDVDAVRSCIGKDAIRLNRIINQLGNGNKNKERIDIINYSEVPGLFIAENFKHCTVLGVGIDSEENKEATIVVEDGEYDKAVLASKSYFHKNKSVNKINLTLAEEITGYSIVILEKSEAESEGFKYQTLDELKELDRIKQIEVEKERIKAITDALRGRSSDTVEAELSKVEANRIASQEEAKKAKAEEKKTGETVKKPTAPAFSSLEEELAKMKAAQAKAQEALEKAEQHEAEIVKVNTTTSLSDLENQLEAQKKKETTPKNPRKPRKIENKVEEDKKEEDKNTPATPKMAIYTEEELADMEAEDNEYDENVDDIDLDENFEDYDDYYEDK